MTEDQIKAIEAEAAMLWRGGANIEALLSFLRERGLNQPRSKDALEKVASIETAEAQLAVLESETWKDQYERNLLIAEQMSEALVQLTQEANPDFTIVLADSEQPHLNPSQILNRTCRDHQTPSEPS